MRKVLVTGGAGFIGSHICENLNKTLDVYVLDNLSNGDLQNIKFINDDHIFIEDIRNKKFLTNIIKEYQFNYIIHLAAVVSVADSILYPELSHEVNARATFDLLDIVRQHHINVEKIIFASSAAVYGNLPTLPKRIDSPVMPISPYAVDKYYGERTLLNYHLLYGLPTVALRFFNVYGPRQKSTSPYSGVISKMFNCYRNRCDFTFYGDGLQTRDYIYINDLVSAVNIVMNIEESNGQVFNVATGKETSLKNVFDLFASTVGYSINCHYKDMRSGDIKHSYADISELEKLGYIPKYDLKDGLRNYVKSEGL